jgi:hypothetical protein
MSGGCHLVGGMNDTPAGQGCMCFDNDESQNDNVDKFVKVLEI